MAFWLGGKGNDKLEWTQAFGWMWVFQDMISKLLGSPFGLFLGFANVNNFLLEKIQRKLKYWSSTILLLARRLAIVITSSYPCCDTLSTFGQGQKQVQIKLGRCYPITCGLDPLKTIIVELLRTNARKKKRSWARLVNPTKAIDALLSKWVLHVLESEEFNL